MDTRKAQELLQHASEFEFGERTVRFLRDMIAADLPTTSEPATLGSLSLGRGCEKSLIDMAIFTAPVVIP